MPARLAALWKPWSQGGRTSGNGTGHTMDQTGRSPRSIRVSNLDRESHPVEWGSGRLRASAGPGPWGRHRCPTTDTAGVLGGSAFGGPPFPGYQVYDPQTPASTPPVHLWIFPLWFPVRWTSGMTARRVLSALASPHRPLGFPAGRARTHGCGSSAGPQRTHSRLGFARLESFGVVIQIVFFLGPSSGPWFRGSRRWNPVHLSAGVFRTGVQHLIIVLV